MKPFWFYLGVLAVAAGAFSFVPANTWQHDLWQVAVGWAAAATVIVSVRCRRATGTAAWYLFAGGVFLNASGILVAGSSHECMASLSPVRRRWPTFSG